MALNDAQRTQIERRLIEERTAALRMLGRETHEDSTDQERSGELTKMPTHMADLGSDTMDAELDASNAGRISVELAEIDAALERLYKHPEKFGVCEKTGRDIPFERLRMIPWARTGA